MVEKNNNVRDNICGDLVHAAISSFSFVLSRFLFLPNVIRKTFLVV